MGEDGRFGQLVEDGDYDGRGEPARQHQPALTATGRPAASTTAAQRRQRSGYPGISPTSVSTLQQRSQRSPDAGDTRTPTSGTSGSVKASSGTGSARTVPAEVMQSSARSTSLSRSAIAA